MMMNDDNVTIFKPQVKKHFSLVGCVADVAQELQVKGEGQYSYHKTSFIYYPFNNGN
jgi:hypothetical protein